MTLASICCDRPRRPEPGRPGAARTAGLAVAVALAPHLALAGGLSGMATEWTQLLNNAELGKIIGLETRSLNVETQSLAAETSQLQTQLQALEIMRRNSVVLPDHAIGNVIEPVVRLHRIASRAGSLAVDGRATDAFLRSGLVTDPLYERDGLDRAQVAERYDAWSAQWQGSMETNLQQAGFTLQDVETEAQLIDRIQSRMGTEEGQMQVLQGANLVAASMARQLNDLRRITATQAEQTSIAWGRSLEEMDRREAVQRDHERDLREAGERLGNTPAGPTLNEIFGVGE
ncbi:MAG: hypothetical protein F4103_09195 [Boseongicola sp. SB0673_bin_14]|nr:hypothetical protein [Boseongicola sp. SB0667_bin_21]MYI68890.1 hypothetical protein [Boseongicola sp. SB0673_bin_14]